MSDLNFPPNAFHKMDMSDDAAFYAEARLVTHIDDTAIAAKNESGIEIRPARWSSAAVAGSQRDRLVSLRR